MSEANQEYSVIEVQAVRSESPLKICFVMVAGIILFILLLWMRIEYSKERQRSITMYYQGWKVWRTIQLKPLKIKENFKQVEIKRSEKVILDNSCHNLFANFQIF